MLSEERVICPLSVEDVLLLFFSSCLLGSSANEGVVQFFRSFSGAFDQLSRNKLWQMISGHLSVPHAQREKPKLVCFIIEYASKELLQDLKQRAENSHQERCQAASEFVFREIGKRVFIAKWFVCSSW